MEGSYIPKSRLRRVDPARKPFLYLDNGATELVLDNHDNTAVVRWSLREQGVVLAGPDPKSLVDPVPAEELRRNVLESMDEWESWLAARDAPMSRRLQGLLVLSFCRMLQTLETGRVTSKREAGEWALGALDQEWAGSSKPRSTTGPTRGGRCTSRPTPQAPTARWPSWPTLATWRRREANSCPDSAVAERHRIVPLQLDADGCSTPFFG